MISKELIKKKVEELDILASTVEVCTKQILENTPIIADRSSKFPKYSWGYIPDGFNILQRDTLNQYQSWYSSAYQLIKEYHPEKVDEFNSCYDGYPIKGVLSYIQLRSDLYSMDKKDVIKRFDERFNLQRSILYSVPSVIEIRDLSLRKIIAADFIDSELDQAELLFKSGFERAAGAIAGVALEKHLKILCDIKGVAYEHKDTIEPLAQALYSAGEIENTELKKIIYLGGIRNDCAHPNPASKDQVRALIEQVKKIVG